MYCSGSQLLLLQSRCCTKKLFFPFPDVLVEEWACRQAGCSSGHPSPWVQATPTCGAGCPWAVAWGHLRLSARSSLFLHPNLGHKQPALPLGWSAFGCAYFPGRCPCDLWLGWEHSDSGQGLFLHPVLAHLLSLYPLDVIGNFLTHPGLAALPAFWGPYWFASSVQAAHENSADPKHKQATWDARVALQRADLGVQKTGSIHI